MVVRKTVHIPIEDKTWTAFKIRALNLGKSVDGLVSELVYREVSDAAFEEPEGEKGFSK